MKKLGAAALTFVFVAVLTGISFAGGYEKPACEWKEKKSEESTADVTTEPTAEKTETIAENKETPAPGTPGYDESELNKNLAGAGETTRNAGKTIGDVVGGFFRQCGVVIEGAGRTTGEVLVGAGKTGAEGLKGAADQSGRMLLGAGESTAKAADNTGKAVIGEVKE